MKGKLLYILLAISAIAAAVYFFVFHEKEKKESEQPPKPAEKPPINAVAPTVPKLYSTDAGEGKSAIIARMKEIFNSAEKDTIRQNSGLFEKLYVGLTYPNGVKQAVTASQGHPYNIEIVPDTISINQKARIEAVKATEGFEKITSRNGVDFAKTAWEGVASWPEFNIMLWPAQLPNLIETGAFGEPTRADANRSERYDAYTTDLKRLVDNMQLIRQSMETALRAKAIEDLRASGWKFIGIDQPANT